MSKIAAAIAFVAFGFVGTANASIIPIGSSLTFGGTNLPGACTDTSCSDTVAFGTPTLIDGGALLLTEKQVADGANAEWDVWSISTVSGGPVAGDINGYWALVMDYTLGAAVNFDQVVNQWTVSGKPVSPLTNFAGICCATATNPSPITGEAYYNSGFDVPLSAGVQSGWQQIFVNPYNYVAAGGIDPTSANGFQFALHFTLQNPVATPEPASLALLAVGMLGLGALRRRA